LRAVRDALNDVILLRFVELICSIRDEYPDKSLYALVIKMLLVAGHSSRSDIEANPD
jgi:hypothetical protein